MSNTAASVRAKLLQISKSENLPFQVVIFRYLHERFLYRLSISPFNDKLFLKGGNLLYSKEGEKTRPTKDLDLLAQSISNDQATIKVAFQSICQISYEPDAVWFDAQSIDPESITTEDKYEGIRLKIEAGFDTIRQRIQKDIGFGDVMVPQPRQISYPILIEGMDSPQIQAYSIETVVAEKFQAMIELSLANSRMKDFYDVYSILYSGNYNPVDLEKAIVSTFKNRGTKFQVNHAFFTPEFSTSTRMQGFWEAFLSKNQLSAPMDFVPIVSGIFQKLQPIWERMKNED